MEEKQKRGMKRKRNKGEEETLDSTANDHINMADNNIASKLPLIEKNETNIKTWTDTEIKIAKVTNTWRIRNFSYCREETGQAMESECFSSGAKDDDEWYLELYPNGIEEKYKDHLSFYACLKSCKKEPILATLKFAMYNDKMKEFKCSQTKHSFSIGAGHGFHKFVERDLVNGKDLLPNDTLTLSCEVIITGNTVKVSGPDIYPKFKEPSSSLLDNFNHLFDTQKLSDVTLVAGEKKFQVHKAILLAQSSVFSAIFEENTTTIQNCINIIDSEQDVVEKMLRFIYSGKVEKIEESAESLLVVADKYGIDSLKLICQAELKKNLSIENASHTLILADLHNVDWLKRKTIEFINMNKMAVMGTEGFKSTVISYPHLIAEVFINSVMQNNCNSDEAMQSMEDAQSAAKTLG